MRYEIEAKAAGTTDDIVPFWMRSNQHGSIPENGVSGSFLGRVYKDYDHTNESLFDWGIGFEGRANTGKTSKLLLIEGYVKAKASIFELKAGRTKDVMGLNGDSLLTSGNFSVSGNALGIPKIEISIPDYYSIPIWNNLFSIKGTFSHGWLGEQRIREIIGSDKGTGRPFYSYSDKANTFLHQKSLYARLGKASWKAKLAGGFNHQVFWGNERDILGRNFELSNSKTFLYVITGKAYGNSKGDISRSKIGNHIGSIDISLDYQFKSFNLKAYRQNLYETGALAKLANVKDGLSGITLENKDIIRSSSSLHWNKILFEYLYTKHQAGVKGSKSTNSGDEDYYNNYIYEKGWSYNNLSLGSPFLTTRKDIREGTINDPIDFFVNNRLSLFHIGLDFSVLKWNYILKSSHSKNFGTFATSEEGRTTGTIVSPPRYGIFKTVSQFSGSIQAFRDLPKNTKLGITAAMDRGKLLENTVGFELSLTRRF